MPLQKSSLFLGHLELARQNNNKTSSPNTCRRVFVCALQGPLLPKTHQVSNTIAGHLLTRAKERPVRSRRLRAQLPLQPQRAGAAPQKVRATALPGASSPAASNALLRQMFEVKP